MAIAFPSSPSSGQVYVYGSRQWRFNGVGWEAIVPDKRVSPTDIGAEPAIAAGTIDQFWRGDKTWQNLADSVRHTILSGLSTATAAAISAADTVLSALGKLQAQVNQRSVDSYVLNRSNHTGTQTLSTISDAGTAASRNATTSPTDTTSDRLWRTNDLKKITSMEDETDGSVLLTGAGGVLGNPSLFSGNVDDISTTVRGRRYIQGAATGTKPATYGIIDTMGFKNDAFIQIWYSFTNAGGTYAVYHRNYYPGFGWSTWLPFYDASTLGVAAGASASAPGTVGLFPAAPAGNIYDYLSRDGVYRPSVPTVQAWSTTSKTLALSDASNYIRATSTSASTLSVPANSSVSIPIDAEFHVRRSANANLTISAASGVTINAPAGGSLVMTQNMTATLKKVGTNEWDLIGQTVAA